MQINYQDLFKEQAVFIGLPIILIVVFIMGLGYTGNQSFVNIKKYNDNAAQVETLTQKKLGVIYGTGTWDKGDVYQHPAYTQAYEMGKQL